VSQPELLARIVQTLDDAGIAYMLTGSVVSSYQGQPRSTHDIDIVVEITPDQVPAIGAAFPADDYAFDEVAAIQAIAKRDMFQLNEFATGDKVDFWVLKDDAFDANVFSRRIPATIVGVHAFIPPPEDTILRKLMWAQEYESEKQFRDALGVYELQYANLDKAYLKHWIAELKLEPTWERMVSEAEPLKD
jgi:hypothetical protein